MSYYIKIHGWTGQNSATAIEQFAKVFRFSVAQAAAIMKDIGRGQSWQFDRTISPLQSEPARIYLQSLGYSVELIPFSPTAPKAEKRAAYETLEAPIEALPKKSALDFLKKFKLGGLSGNVKKAPPQHQVEDERAELPKKSFLDFLKKKTADTATHEVKKAEPTAYRKKSSVGLLVVLVLMMTPSLLPYYYGMRAEAILNELMPRMFQKGVVFKLRSYDRGWLRSVAEFTIDSPAGGSFQGTSEIEHGPLSIDALMDGNFDLFQARIESKIPFILPKAPEGGQATDPLENLVMKGYFVKKGRMYKMDLLVLDEGLNVNGKLIPNAQN